MGQSEHREGCDSSSERYNKQIDRHSQRRKREGGRGRRRKDKAEDNKSKLYNLVESQNVWGRFCRHGTRLNRLDRQNHLKPVRR